MDKSLRVNYTLNEANKFDRFKIRHWKDIQAQIDTQVLMHTSSAKSTLTTANIHTFTEYI